MINYKAIIAIYFHEIERTKRTIFQSIISPILTTSLYFIIFELVVKRPRYNYNFIIIIDYELAS